VPTGVAARWAVPAGCTGKALGCTGWPVALHRKEHIGAACVRGERDVAAAASDGGGAGFGVLAAGRPDARW